MWKYWLLLTDRGADEIEAEHKRVKAGAKHPMEAKKELAGAIVTEFHSAEDAAAARQEFERVFSAGRLPQEIPEIIIHASGETMLLSKILVEGNLATSNSDARRLIEQGGVRVDGEAVCDIKADVSTTEPQPVLVQVGKRRFARLSFTRHKA